MLTFRAARLRERIGLIVLIHLVMMVGVVFLFIVETDASKIAPLYRLPDPLKVMLVATAFEHTPPDTHADLARAFSDATLNVSLRKSLPQPLPGAATPETVAQYREALSGRPFRIESFGSRAPASFRTRPFFSPDAVRVSVALPDGHAVAVEQMAIEPIAKIIDNRMLFLLAVALVDIGFVLWLASQTTGPVERLARAVRDDRLDDLAPGGPLEIAKLAESFQQLRGRLRDLLHERTRMLAAIAHDYRTYLTRLELRSEFIGDDEQRALAAGDLSEMRQLISDTLTFARESTTTGSDGATCDIRDELAAIAIERRGRGEAVEVLKMLKPIVAQASHVSFQRMMANLLDNAVRYGAGRAMVRVRAEKDLVHILVEDDGPGVPEESLARLLKPFERLEQSRARHTGGVGLGLSIVQALALRYGGTLTLQNREGRGFRAILTLRAA